MYTEGMRSKPPSKTQSAIKKLDPVQRARLRSVASSTAIETGETVAAVEKKLVRLRAASKRALLG